MWADCERSSFSHPSCSDAEEARAVNASRVDGQERSHLLDSLPFVALAVRVRVRHVAAHGDLRGDLEEDLAIGTVVLGARRSRHGRRVVHGGVVVPGSGVSHGLGVVNQVHDDSTRAVRTGVLRQVVGAGELLATFVALKGLLLGVQRAVVALEVLLSAEATGAELADEGLARVLGQGLLAAAAVGGSSAGRGAVVRCTGRGVAVLRGAALGRGASALALALLRVVLLLRVRGVGLLGLVDDIHVLLLGALAAVAVGAGGRVGGAGHGIGLRVVFTIGREAVRGGARAGARAGGVVVAQVDKAVDEAVLGGEVREVVVDGQAVGHGWCNVAEGGRGAGRVGDCRGCLRVGECVTTEHKLAFFLVTAARQCRELGSKGGVDGADRQVARVAKVQVLRGVLRGHRGGVGSGRRGQRRAGQCRRGRGEDVGGLAAARQWGCTVLGS